MAICLHQTKTSYSPHDLYITIKLPYLDPQSGPFYVEAPSKAAALFSNQPTHFRPCSSPSLQVNAERFAFGEFALLIGLSRRHRLSEFLERNRFICLDFWYGARDKGKLYVIILTRRLDCGGGYTEG